MLWILSEILETTIIAQSSDFLVFLGSKILRTWPNRGLWGGVQKIDNQIALP